MQVYLLEFHLMGRDWRPCAIEDKEPCTRRTLVDRADEPLLELLFTLLRNLCLVTVSGHLLGGRGVCGLGHLKVIAIGE